MELSILDLVVTQNRLRDYEQISGMVASLKKGEEFTGISLIQTPDHKVWVHDGHHRLFAMFLKEKYWLGKNQYKITQFAYSDIDEPNVAEGWITPFDLNMEVRKPDISFYKEMMWLYLASQKISNGHYQITQARRQGVYLEERSSYFVTDFRKFYEKETN